MNLLLAISSRQRLWIGSLLILVVVGWISYRMYRRLSVEPYVDFHAFYLAADAARTGADPYRAGTEMYIYPPMLAAWMSPLSLLTEEEAGWVWYGLSLLVTLGSLLLAWRTVRRRLMFNIESHDLLLVLGLTLLIWIPQCRWEFEQGQTDWLMLAGLCLALAFLNRSSVIVGLAIGFAMNIKYLPIVFLAYFLVRRRWSHLCWSVVGTVLWSLAPALVYGWRQNLVFLQHGLAGLAKLIGIQIEGQAGYVFPLTYDRSLTIPSAFARWAEQANLGFFFVIGMTLIAAFLVCLLGWVVYRLQGFSLFANRGGQQECQPDLQGVTTLEFLVIMALMLMFSPQAMLRHFFLVLPLIMTTVMFALRGPTTISRRSAWCALMIAIIGSIGADLVTPFGWREIWKASSSMSLGLLVLTFVMLVNGLTQFRHTQEAGFLTSGNQSQETKSGDTWEKAA